MEQIAEFVVRNGKAIIAHRIDHLLSCETVVVRRPWRPASAFSPVHHGHRAAGLENPHEFSDQLATVGHFMIEKRAENHVNGPFVEARFRRIGEDWNNRIPQIVFRGKGSKFVEHFLGVIHAEHATAGHDFRSNPECKETGTASHVSTGHATADTGDFKKLKRPGPLGAIRLDKRVQVGWIEVPFSAQDYPPRRAVSSAVLEDSIPEFPSAANSLYPN